MDGKLSRNENFEFQHQQAILHEHYPEMGLLFDSISQSIILIWYIYVHKA